MAGDWIKICKDTPSKPEILVIATKLSIHPDIAFARCFQLWAWFDSNTKEGVTSGVTKVTLDALLHCDRLCDALMLVGWLGETEAGDLYLPNFDYHNSESAKSRALHKNRQEKYRNNRHESDAATVTEASPEKRREEKNIKPNTNTLSPPAAPKADSVPYEKIVSLYHEHLPTCPKVAKLTVKRKGQIAARWKSGDIPDLSTWESYFSFVSKSKFLTGLCDPPEGHKRFVADLEWITNESNFTKIWEKKYHGEV